MPAARSKSLIAIVILLVLLVLVSGAALVFSPLGFGGGGFPGRGAGGFAGGTRAGGLQGSSASAGSSQGGSTSAGSLPGGGNGGGFQGGNGGNFQGRGGAAGGGFLSFLTLGGIFRLLGIDFQYMGAANLGVPIFGILLALIAALGLWMQKRWALYLAVLVGILFLLGAFPGLLTGFVRFSLTRTGMAALNALFALGVIVLACLPSTRKSLS